MFLGLQIWDCGFEGEILQLGLSISDCRGFKKFRALGFGVFVFSVSASTSIGRPFCMLGSVDSGSVDALIWHVVG